jgi:hypothetical protein
MQQTGKQRVDSPIDANVWERGNNAWARQEGNSGDCDEINENQKFGFCCLKIISDEI